MADPFTLTDEQAQLAVEALRNTFLFDGWSMVPERDRPLLIDTLRALGEFEVDAEIADVLGDDEPRPLPDPADVQPVVVTP
jgi:hypothetical protein